MHRRTVYEVEVNTDLTEGRGPTRTLARFDNRHDAVEVVDDPRFANWCVMGVHRPGYERGCIKTVEIVIYESASEFWKGHDEVRRLAALAKLTAEDRKVLGLE